MNARTNQWIVLTRTRVLIVGGGLAGLSAALFLAWHGVDCVLVDHHADVLRHPRMRSLAPRLVEMYRPMGLEPLLAEHGDTFADHELFTMVRAETLAAEHTRLDKDLDSARTVAASPCRGIPIDQDAAERIVRQRAVELGADIRYGVRLAGFTEEDPGVLARLLAADGAVSAVRADYLIAADGADSAIRERQGIAMTGPGELCRMLSIQFEADLRPILGRRSVHMAYVNRPYPQTYLMSLSADGRRWVLGTTDPGTGELSEADCEALVHTALGRQLPIRLLPPIPGSSRPALRFGMGAAVAERLCEDRTFLIGDAAHHMPPPGGFGGTTGVADAHNLAWKIAAVLTERAKPSLLDTYHRERHPVAEFTMRQALARAGARLGLDIEPDPIVERTEVMLGYRYGPAPVHGAVPGEVGTRFPHRWLPSGESTLDLFGSGFVLVTGPAAETWSAAVHEDVTVHRLDLDLPGINPDGAILVRPDGFVAWLWPTAVADPGGGLARAMTDILAGRTPATPLTEPRAGPLLSSANVHSDRSDHHRSRHPGTCRATADLARGTPRPDPR